MSLEPKPIDTSAKQAADAKASLLLRGVRRAGYGFLNRFGDYPVIPGATPSSRSAASSLRTVFRRNSSK